MVTRTRRVLLFVFSALLLSSLLVAGWQWRQHVRLDAQERVLAVRLPAVVAGTSKERVGELLGEPSFVEHAISDSFAATDRACRQRARSCFIYQQRRLWWSRSVSRDTIVIFFDDADRVLCVEQKPAFRILYR